MIYRHWHGPVIGINVSHVWSSYASVVFLEFGKLSAREPLSKGRLGQPRGEYGLSTMQSWPFWSLSVHERIAATSDSVTSVRAAGLRLMIGRRLKTLEISVDGQSTHLQFSLGVTLTTATEMRELRSEPHWHLFGPERGHDKQGSSVVLKAHATNPKYWQ